MNHYKEVGHVSESNVTIATYPTHKYGKRQGYSTVFAISKDLRKEARMLIGDRVDVLIDEDNREIYLKRVTDGSGWALYAAPKGKSGEKRQAALERSRLRVKIRVYPGVPAVANPVTITDYRLVDDGIIFPIPDEVSLESNPREDAHD